jgi:hypothetical protein
MKGIRLFFIFPARLPKHDTTSNLATYPEEALGNTRYHHQGSGIPYT